MVNQEMLSTKRFSTLQSTSTTKRDSNKYRAVACGRDFLFRLASAEFSLISYRDEDLVTNCTLPANYLLRVHFWEPSFSHRVYTCLPSRQLMGPNQAVLQVLYKHQAKPTIQSTESSRMRFRSHLNVCNSLASHVLPWPFTRHKVKLLKLSVLTSSYRDFWVMTPNGELRNFVYKEVLQ